MSEYRVQRSHLSITVTVKHEKKYEKWPQRKRYDRGRTVPDSIAFYDTHPGNGWGQFFDVQEGIFQRIYLYRMAYERILRNLARGYVSST